MHSDVVLNKFELHLDVFYLYLFIGLDLPTGCKQNAFKIHLDVSEIYFRCNLSVVIHGPGQGSWV